MKLIHHNTEKGKRQFELIDGKRPWHILLLISKGSISVSFPDRGLVCTVAENEAVLLPANIAFCRRVLTPIDFHQFAFFSEEPPPEPGKLAIPQSHVAAVSESMERIALRSDNRQAILHMLEHLLIEHRLFDQPNDAPAHGLDEDITAALRYMHDHLSERLDMDALAAHVHLSHTGLIWKFRRQLSTTPSQYLIMLRLHRAKQLLLEGELRVNEIAKQCGYANAYYFTNAFRRHTGRSPTAFRKHYLSGS